MNASKLIAAAVFFIASGAAYSQQGGVSPTTPKVLASNDNGVATKPSTRLSKSVAADSVGATETKHPVTTQKPEKWRADFRAEMVKINGGKPEDYSDL